MSFFTNLLKYKVVRTQTDASGAVSLVGAGGSASFNDCGMFGASPSATAAVNTAAIQGALNVGGYVTITTPGVYNITSAGLGTEILRILSDTTLYLAPGVIVRGPALGTNVVPLIANSNWRSNKVSVSSITCSTSAAPYVTTATMTTATAHGYSVDDYILIKGDTAGYYNGVWKVATVPSTTTLTFLMFGFSVAPPNAAGTVISYAANANFKIIGEGVFDGNLNTTNGGTLGDLGKFGSIFNKVADYEVSCGFVNTAKYGIQFCNSYRSTFRPGTFQTPSDGVHGSGPLMQCRVEGFYGATGDDCVALTANNTNYTQYDLKDADGTKNSDGDITDVEILYPQIAVGGSRMVLLATGHGLNVKRVTVRGITRQSSLSGLYALIDIQGAETGSFEDISFDGIYGDMPLNTPIVSVGTGTGTINIKNLSLANIGSHGGAVGGGSTALTHAILGGSNSVVNITGLKVDGVHVDVDLTNAPANIGLLSLGGGSGLWTVNKIKLSRITAAGTGNTRSLTLLSLPGQFDSAQIENCHISASTSSLASVTSTQTGTGTIQVSNSDVDGDGTNNGQSIVTSSGGKSLNVMISNTKGGAALNGGVYVYGGTGKTFNVYLNNVKTSHKLIVNAGTTHTFNVLESNVSCDNYTQASGNMIAVGTTSTWNFNGSCADIGIDASTIARKDGTIIYNTNAALGTLAAAGLVVGQGTAANSWHLMADPTKLY